MGEVTGVGWRSRAAARAGFLSQTGEADVPSDLI